MELRGVSDEIFELFEFIRVYQIVFKDTRRSLAASKQAVPTYLSV